MSLSKKIIFDSDQEVANTLKTEPKLNELDEYGYTPLIQTAIVNSVSKAELLLKAGAAIDFPDLTGRTALSWAADNNNLELCRLLLKYHADPNSYAIGGQSVLVMPLLKRHHEVKNLLITAGGRLHFAQDFLNAKFLGHSFELEGRVDIVDTNNTFIEVEYEGFYLRFTLEVILSSLIDFKNNFGAKKLRKYFAKLDVIIHALQVSTELIRLQHYLVDIKQYLTKINELLDHQPLILPIAFGGHAITLIKYWDWLIRCDRGEYGRTYGTVIYYNMREPTRLTKSFGRELIYKRQFPEFINTGLIDHLGLEAKFKLPLSPQRAGTCAWANVEAVIPSLMYLLLLDEKGDEPTTCEEEALSFYHAWREWNKTRSLDFCLQSFEEASPAQRAAKAALLGSILFQACDYYSAQDREKAEKILKILSTPEYDQVLRCYIKVFSQDQKNEYLKNLYNFLEDYGIDVDRLRMGIPISSL